MVRHPRIMRVSMTGSVPAGKAVMAEAAPELKSITLELGGNDPAIVLDDVDPKEIAQSAFSLPCLVPGLTSSVGAYCSARRTIAGRRASR